MPGLARSGGTAYVYVAPCRGEDLAKLGFSRDPLQRLQSLQPRWFEFFDLDAGWLIEADHERDARDLELALRRRLPELNAPAPLRVERAAAGHTEWFRGALPALSAASHELAAAGHPLHRPLRDWLRPRLDARSDRLFQWAEAALQAIEHAAHVGAPDAAAERLLLDRLDALPALGLALAERVPEAVLQWHAARTGDAGWSLR